MSCLLPSNRMFSFMLHLQLFYIKTRTPRFMLCFAHSFVQFNICMLYHKQMPAFAQDLHCTRDNDSTKLRRTLILSITFGIPPIIYFTSFVPMHESILTITSQSGLQHACLHKQYILYTTTLCETLPWKCF